MLLGCIADDFTGATDLANTLTRQGMRTLQTIGIMDHAPPEADAVVVALKSRTIAPAEAVDQSLQACRWLRRHGAAQIYFKYCSTFDSTDQGNIGPVADALLEELGADLTAVCPAFPENGRTIYMGHLFVGGVLLSDSSMRHHPLTPMTDSNLVRVMSRQSRFKVGLVPLSTVEQGAGAIGAAFDAARKSGRRHVVVDCVSDDNLLAIGKACAPLKLVTGGSGAALGLPANLVADGRLTLRATAAELSPLGGRAAVLSGSCSAATNAQVAAFKAQAPSRALDLDAVFADPGREVDAVADWALAQSPDQTPLIYSTDTPDNVQRVQARVGRATAGEEIERALGDIAAKLAARGFRRFVVAGGETSGAVTKALQVEMLAIGPQIAPGVPATHSLGKTVLGLVLKSGNFGGPDFFADALKVLR